jgi:predicted nucleic acid-binding protein
MQQKIFLDANVLIDFIYADNKFNKQTLFLFNELRRKKERLYCSPTSFSITYYFLSKALKNKKLLNKKTTDFFSYFIFTREDNLIMEKVIKSNFRDLEDALQYFSAEDSGIDIIITKNFFDYEHSVIPVYHPLEYINQFLI